jgi:hypothetical protein
MDSLLETLKGVRHNSPEEEVKKTAELVILYADEIGDDEAARGLEKLMREFLFLLEHASLPED